MMNNTEILTPSKPKIVKEEGFSGVYEIDGLYPGYGHTLGNSLRRIILSSLPGAAITSVKIDGVQHEFSTLEGIEEDVIKILLNLKNAQIKMYTEEAQVVNVSIKGVGQLKVEDLAKENSLIEIMNPDHVIANLTDKKASLQMQFTVEKGLGYIPKEELNNDKVDIGTITLDASFTPIRRVSYEVENMRVKDRIDFNKLRISIETDGTITPKEALEDSISIMIKQLKAIVGFKEEEDQSEINSELSGVVDENKELDYEDGEKEGVQKISIESADLSTRTLNALNNANIRTLGGLSRKKEKDLLQLDGLGAKGVQEIKAVLKKNGITLKEE